MTTVIKVQSPQFTNGARQYLVYDQLGARTCLIPEEDVPSVVRSLVVKQGGKWFFEGEWDQESEMWTIGNPTHWRDW